MVIRDNWRYHEPVRITSVGLHGAVTMGMKFVEEFGVDFHTDDMLMVMRAFDMSTEEREMFNLGVIDALRLQIQKGMV